MKQQFICDICGKVYNTEEEALACELKCEEKRQAEIKKEEEAKAKLKEKEARHKQINDLIKAYIEDYDEFPPYVVLRKGKENNVNTYDLDKLFKYPFFDIFLN